MIDDVEEGIFVESDDDYGAGDDALLLAGDAGSYTVQLFVSVLACVIAGAALLLQARRKESSAGRPPWAPGLRLPLLGHALAYKANPTGFLMRARDAVGPTFSIDLAGLVTTIVSDPATMRKVANEPESMLSARAAVSDFGFGLTLGEDNVFHGTDLHKRVLKNHVYKATSDRELALSLAPLVSDGMRLAFPRRSGTSWDFIQAVRRVAFHAVVHHMVGPAVHEAYDHPAGERKDRSFMDDFMAFQDGLEEATAKGVTLPRAVAVALVWGPVKRRRAEIARRLARAIDEASAADRGRNFTSRAGVWLRASLEDASLDSARRAELIIGLLFAAHKVGR